ncbi:scavenger receptor cysteine-rich type 1 protein M130-like [Astyanax mexicanus]|uniref:Scavenger receptor cysteine-rich type 1 protein M130-like n=1 Tax=Astyanax mexicanus TaxID=7994 RepID=A0A8T2KK48_ASTMX|nr:scavenger receptor cysteine-rich type 1 protein M130-like [Astyanax mexicanus]
MIEVRLADSDEQCSGTPKVLSMEILTDVSSRSFDLRAAMVVCRELDCGNAVRVTTARQTSEEGRNRGYVQMIDCTGHESAVSQCQQQQISLDSGFVSIRTRVVCSESVRLVDGDGFCSGRLEVKTNQSWSRVCETDFDRQDAEVVCRELGCGTPLTLQGELFGEGTHPFGTKEFQCKGTEEHLLTCSASTREEHTCTHGKAVGLACSGPRDVRLVGGDSRCAGTVEMFHSGEWRELNGEAWFRREAAVVCRQLDCGSAVVANVKRPLSSEPGWSVATDCGGSEPALRECATFVHLQTEVLAAVTCSGTSSDENKELI